jgi:gag-polyprotein putative aspartyl protease
MVVEVSLNHAGPYDFLLDTGSQMTVVDRSLAAELQIPIGGDADVVGVSFQGKASFAQVDALGVGDHGSVHRRVLVYDMNNVKQAGFAIRGLLGEDFLSRFDVLIDNTHHVLCIDDKGAMQLGLKGVAQSEGK